MIIKAALKYSMLIPCKRQYSNRSVKAYKFLPAPNKSVKKKASKLPLVKKIDIDTAEHLEKLSLVGFENEKTVQIVEEAIRFADEIFEVNTENVKPLITVLEDEALFSREDMPKSDVTRTELLCQTNVSLENYFVSPLGNQEFIPEKKSFELPDIKKVCEN